MTLLLPGRPMGRGSRPKWRIILAPAVPTVLTLSDLGFGANALGTFMFRGTITAVGTGTAQVILQVDTGATSNRIFCQVAAGNGVTQFGRTTGGSGATTNDGSLTNGATFSVGMSIDGAGGVIGFLAGSTAVTAAGAPTSGLTTFRIGSTVAGGGAFGGSVIKVAYRPGVALSSDALAAAVAAFT